MRTWLVLCLAAVATTQHQANDGASGTHTPHLLDSTERTERVITLESLQQSAGPMRCPHNCFEKLGRGTCSNGACECADGAVGESCIDDATNCNMDCSKHGRCDGTTCRCDKGWSGTACDVLVTCPKDCSGRGVCTSDGCVCDDGYGGADCGVLKTGCLNDCMGRGACMGSVCHCDRGFAGPDCSDKSACRRLGAAQVSAPECAFLFESGKYYVHSDLDIAEANAVLAERLPPTGESCAGQPLAKQRAKGVICAEVLPYCNPMTTSEVKACLAECKVVAAECKMEGSKLCNVSHFVNEEEAPVPPHNYHHDQSRHLPRCKQLVLPGSIPCPNDCSGHGQCNTNTGVCRCQAVWSGAADCSVPSCPRNCSYHGTCLGGDNAGTCDCDRGWTRVDCSAMTCPNDCTAASHGTCNNGTCECYGVWGGDDCSEPQCPNDCSNHGTCLDKPASAAGTCKCDSGWGAKDCSERLCPKDCSGHGTCSKATGVCACEFGWVDEDCGRARCPNDCSGHGECLQGPGPNGKEAGECVCEKGYSGRDCSRIACPLDCSDRGECNQRTGECICEQLYYGDGCEKTRCPNHCFGSHGKCKNGTCECNEPWTGVDCAKAVCPHAEGKGACSGHGDCLQVGSKAGTCDCYVPWTGDLGCGVAECKNDCSGHGECLQNDKDGGNCACDKGWQGDDCAFPDYNCPNDCSNHGECVEGDVCVCQEGFTGEDCSKAICPNNCTSKANGACDKKTGLCNCYDPFTGPDCSVAVCPKECSNHGDCDTKTGVCSCDDPYFDVDCSLIHCGEKMFGWVCANDGVCDNTTGICACPPGWGGDDCSLALDSLTASPSNTPSDTATASVTATPTSSATVSFSPSVTVSWSVSASASFTYSETASATVTPSATLSANVRCPLGCSGHGDCDTGSGTCSCTEGWTEEDCGTAICNPPDGTADPNEPACSGHGACVAPDTCVCDDGFEGAICTSPSCVYGCNGHGTCDPSSPKCICDEPWSNMQDITPSYEGPGCTYKACPAPPPLRIECSGHGNCLDGMCKCEESWGGPDLDCNIRLCKFNCSGHGECVGGICNCSTNYTGEYCAELVYPPPVPTPTPSCPQDDKGVDCYGNGTCDYETEAGEAICNCNDGFWGYDCLDLACSPDLKCGGHGECDGSIGKCYCENPWHGDACELSPCPGLDLNCTGNGACQLDGKCNCFEGWSGKDCSEPKCQDECNNHGHCLTPAPPAACICEDGWNGTLCETPFCPTNCSGRGKCIGAYTCECDPESGYTGPACDERVWCPNNCSWPFGDCTGDGDGAGTCVCREGWLSADCSVEKYTSCRDVENPEGCNGRGICECTGDCQCIPGFSGRSCQHPAICLNQVTRQLGCSGNGQCIDAESGDGLGKCVCFDGFKGTSCELQAADGNEARPGGCPDNCHGQGFCEKGQCKCFVGFTGESCFEFQEVECPGQCSNNGLCEMNEAATAAVCACGPGFTGEACDQPADDCPKNCSCNGVCEGGKGACICNPGWWGPYCDQRLGETCLENCRDRGTCNEGHCACNEPYFGTSCEFSFCPLNCSTSHNRNHGVCNTDTGVCTCNTGFKGEGCEDILCPGDSSCSGPSQGECNYETGVCECKDGFWGPECACKACDPRCELEGNGKCGCDGECVCTEPWTGVACTEVPCQAADMVPHECSGHGECKANQPLYVDKDKTAMTIDESKELQTPKLGYYTGKCICEERHYGLDCSKLRCRMNAAGQVCSNHGVCDTETKECTCDPGWEGVSCTDTALTRCPNECGGQGHGTCNDVGQCDCEEGWYGVSCHVQAGECEVGPNGKICSGIGSCSCNEVTQTCHCKCPMGYSGPACDQAGCGGNPMCNGGECICDPITGICKCMCPPGTYGDQCQFTIGKPCPLNCSNPDEKFGDHGDCRLPDGVCDCYRDWAGAACHRFRCPNNCSGNGVCNMATDTCDCFPGFELAPDCSYGPHFECDPACQNGGECDPATGKCMCPPGLEGDDCSIKICPERCHFKGQCIDGVCDCALGYRGEDCRFFDMGDHMCSGKGIYNRTAGTCDCLDGFSGDDCAETDDPTVFADGNLCMNNCTARGICDHTSLNCTCIDEYHTKDCSERVTKCPMKCRGYGLCMDEHERVLGMPDNIFQKCDCQPKYEGETCEGLLDGWIPAKVRENVTVIGPVKVAPLDCSEHGLANMFGECICFGPPSMKQAYWDGEGCEVPHCPGDCSGPLQGICEENLTCTCINNFTGVACEIPPPECSWCSDRGQCDCRERVTFNGKEQCKCLCDQGFEGPDCNVKSSCPAPMVETAVPPQPLPCAGRGLCILGRCECNTGFFGDDCTITNCTDAGWNRPGEPKVIGDPIMCPVVDGEVCSGNGVCLIDGVCDCFPGFEGPDCSVKVFDCPFSCNGAGECNPYLGTCECFTAFSGMDCTGQDQCPVAIKPCMNNCTGNGRCCNGLCKCLDGWTGSTCHEKVQVCPERCSGNGICGDNGTCECQGGYSGGACEIGPAKAEQCPNNCMGHGLCGIEWPGRCLCHENFQGMDCSIALPRCKNNCSGNGECVGNAYGLQGVSGGLTGVCMCIEGYGDEDCSDPWGGESLDSSSCPNNCSGHGICMEGQCFCTSKYKGHDCSWLDNSCPLGCAGHGYCSDGCCDCKEGFGAVACDMTPLGICMIGYNATCELSPDKKDCESLPQDVCPNNCTGHGLCDEKVKTCDCINPWIGEDCSILSDQCPPPGCDPGVCVDGKCVCPEGFWGDTCQYKVAVTIAEADEQGYIDGLANRIANLTDCPYGCSACGVCNRETGACSCNEGHVGIYCESEGPCKTCSTGAEGDLCPPIMGCTKNCSGQGICVDGNCQCFPPWSGVACDQIIMPCPLLCSGKGICYDGVCACESGYSGEGCEMPSYNNLCANNCSAQGICIDGDCHCPGGLRGVDCTINLAKCPNNCHGKGVCVEDECVCAPGYTGTSCEQTLPDVPSEPLCPDNCTGKGLCQLGRCMCDEDQGYPDCAVTVFICHLGCSGHGDCRAGECHCQDGYSGEGCEIGVATPPCPSNCSGRGVCEFVELDRYNGVYQCNCESPWIGEDCSRFPVCPSSNGLVCSGHGVCEGICGTCYCEEGWGGIDCGTPNGCPQNCSSNGQCIEGVGQCMCEDLFGGRDCATGKDYGEICETLDTYQPGFLGGVVCKLNEDKVRKAVIDHWSEEPASSYGAKLFNAMKSTECIDLLWLMMQLIVMLHYKINLYTPHALVSYDDVKGNAFDICWIESLMEPRLQLFDVRDSISTFPDHSGTIQSLINECNKFHALVYGYEEKDTLRSSRRVVKLEALRLTDLDPTVVTHTPSDSLDDFLYMYLVKSHGQTMMKRALDSRVAGVDQVAQSLLYAAADSNAALEEAKQVLSEAISALDRMGQFEKYLRGVVDLAESAPDGMEQSTELSSLPRGLDLASLIIVYMEQNKAGEMRSKLQGLAWDDPERSNVNLIIKQLNIMISKATIEMPERDTLFNTRVEIQQLTAVLNKHNPTFMNESNTMTADELIEELNKVPNREQLRTLQRVWELRDDANSLLKALNKYLIAQHYLFNEARRMVATLRVVDETLVPDLFVAEAGNLTLQPQNSKLLDLSRQKEYIASLEGYLKADLSVSIPLQKELEVFIYILKALSGAFPYSTYGYRTLLEARRSLMSLYEQMMEKCGLPPLPVDPDRLTTPELLTAFGDEEFMTNVKALADAKPTAGMSPEEYENMLECSKLAAEFLKQYAETVEMAFDAEATLRYAAARVSTVTAGMDPNNPTGIKLSTPSPEGENIVDLLSKLYDFNTWMEIRKCDIRMVNSSAMDEALDCDIVSEATCWCHQMIHTVVGLIGKDTVAVTESTFQESYDELEALTKLCEENPWIHKQGPPECLDWITAWMAAGTMYSQLAIDCGGACNQDQPEWYTSTGGIMCEHVSQAGDMDKYGYDFPVKSIPDSAGLSVRCCNKDGTTAAEAMTPYGYGCYFDRGFCEAKYICESRGLKLCTREELKPNKHAGCGGDAQRLWTEELGGDHGSSLWPVSAMFYSCTPEEAIAACELEYSSFGNHTLKYDNHKYGNMTTGWDPNWWMNGGLGNCTDHYHPTQCLLMFMERLINRLLEMLETILEELLQLLIKIKDSRPECVPATIGVDLLAGDQAATDAVLKVASNQGIEELLNCLNDIPHGFERIDANAAINDAIMVASYLTMSLIELDCGTGGVAVYDKCVCDVYHTGDRCEILVTYDDAYNQGWNSGVSTVTFNATQGHTRDVIMVIANQFDRAAMLVKSTAIAQSRIMPPCEETLPTRYLSALELMRFLEDPAWVKDYRKCDSEPFKAVIPRLLRAAAVLRYEHDDIAMVLKNLAIRAASMDCISMMPVAIEKNEDKPSCGQVADKVTALDKLVLLEKLKMPPVKAEIELLDSGDLPTSLAKIVADMLALINAVERHGMCPSQCSKRGTCLLKKCECDEGWVGDACTFAIPLPAGVCPKNCSGHGTCKNGICDCDNGWKGYDCSVSMVCPNHCSGHGNCIDSRCHCINTWRGYDCSRPREICPDDFSCHRGVCRDTYCICDAGWTGDDCTVGNFHAHEKDAFWDDEAAALIELLEMEGRREADVRDLLAPAVGTRIE